MINIKRKRWVIIKDDSIFCGLSRDFKFKPVDDIGDTAIKTYQSKERAESSFAKSWRGGNELIRSGSVKAVEIFETITDEEMVHVDACLLIAKELQIAKAQLKENGIVFGSKRE